MPSHPSAQGSSGEYNTASSEEKLTGVERILQILAYCVAIPLCFLFLWIIYMTVALLFFRTFIPWFPFWGIIGLVTLAVVYSIYSSWVMDAPGGPAKFYARLKAKKEKRDMREYKREHKQMQRDAAERERSKLYRFMVNGGAFAILLALLLLWGLFSQLI